MTLDVVTVPKLASKFDVKPSTVWYWIRKGWLPQPKRLGNTSFWEEEVIRRHLGLEAAAGSGEIGAGFGKLGAILNAKQAEEIHGDAEESARNEMAAKPI